MIDNFKTFYHHRPRTGLFIVAFFILSLLLTLARLALSPGIIYGATSSWLKKQSIEARKKFWEVPGFCFFRSRLSKDSAISLNDYGLKVHRLFQSD